LLTCAGKKSRSPGYGQASYTIADFELKQAYDNFSIDYVVAPRPQNQGSDVADLTSSFSGLLNSAVQSNVSASATSALGNQMPMLTRKGLLDITTVEVLYDPSKGWGNLNRALLQYRLYQERGPIPRSVIPEYPPPEIMERVKRISMLSKAKADQMLAANAAQHRLAAQGRENALDLIDGPRYYYHS
jgi:hypothetical protein